MSTFTWIESPAWQLDFFGLPHRIPWPEGAPVPDGQHAQFDMAALVSGVEMCVNAEPELIGPWRGFHAAAPHFDAMTEALEDHEYVRAGELLAEIDKHHAGSPYSLFHQAFVARQGGNDQEAVRLYAEAAQKAPGIPFIWDNLGTMLAENGNRDQAVQAFINALQSNPQDQVALESLVQLKAAVKMLRDPKDPKSAVIVPMEQFKQMAEQQLTQIEKHPEQLVAFGEQLLRDGLVPEVGIAALEKANEAKPDQPNVLVALGAGYRMLGKFEESKAAFVRYSELQPQDPWGYFNLAQTANAADDKEAEKAALTKTLEVDPNIQQAIGILFELKGENDIEKENKLVAFADERNAWMPLLIASSMARDRGDIATAVQYVASAHERNPKAEEVMLQYAAMLGDAKDAGTLDIVIQPAVTSGRYSKRLDWNYAQSLRQVEKTSQAIEVLRRAQMGDAPADFKAAAESAIEHWTGLRAQSGATLEVHTSGQLLRPIVLTLEDGDGGILVNPRQALPAQHKFPWRAQGVEARVKLQQGQSGIGGELNRLGTFIVKNVTPATEGNTMVECRVEATPDGRLTLTAGQNGRKLPVDWEA
jgi:tetratricopeptide (TPR) repeat protein